MGIPKFFRWFSERYPLINQLNLQDTYHMAPEYDYLYLDMNGIIHNCTHANISSVLSASLAEEEMFVKVFQYIDKLVHMIRPKKVLYMAIDGVAPRAKLNQQRQRRFKSSFEAAEARELAEAKGEVVSDNPFDSNCITPGTHFMSRLSDHLEYWVRKKIKEDSAWKGMKIIFSGASVPGEGEHKIMEYIRHMQAQPDWEPNQSHVLYGLDADLIMLALVSHEPHFSVLREEVLTSRTRKKSTIGVEDTLFQLLHVSLVREYLDLEFGDLKAQVPYYDLERIIDDFILMCFFVGNDFLPSLPCFDIGEGSLNQVFEVYKGLLPSLGGYLCEGVKIDFQRLGRFLSLLTDRERNFYGEVAIAGFFPPDPDDPEAVDNSDYDPNSDNAWKDYYYRDRFGIGLEDEDFHLDLVMSYLEGLSWNLHYYHNGVVSWGWYYPHFYAPLASDLQDAFEYAAPSGDFTYGKPFKPFQQLMAVLPAASSKLLPTIYRPLMLSPTSPIGEYYPKTFQIDMTGKKFAWEGIAKIPFIEEKRLLSALNELESRTYDQLTPEEKRRNTNGIPRVFMYDERSTEVVQSPAPTLGGFPVLTDSLSRAEDFKLPEFPNPDQKSFRRPAGTSTGLNGRPGFPTLTPLEKSQVNVFGNAARFESMLLTPTLTQHPTFSTGNLAEIGPILVGKRAWVGWPYLRESRVIAVIGKDVQYESGKVRPNTDSERHNFNKEALFRQNQYLASYGIKLDSIEFLVQVQELQGMNYLPTGARKKIFQIEPSLYPLQVVLPRLPRRLYDARFQEQGDLPLTQLFPYKGLTLLTHKNYFGCPAVILGHKEESGQVVVKLEILPSETSLGHKVADKYQESYKSLRTVSQTLGVPGKALAKITGSVFLGVRHTNIGLNLKFSKRQQQILGYSRKIVTDFGHDAWEFSDLAIELIRKYKQEFPRLFQMVIDGPEEEFYPEEMLFDPAELIVPRPPDATDQDYDFLLSEHRKQMFKEKVYAIKNWISSQAYSDLPLVPVGSCEISLEGLKVLTEGIDRRVSERIKLEAGFKTVKIDPKYLLLPVSDDPVTVEQELRINPSEFSLGDRVVTLQSNGAVPFGTRGTITGIVGGKCFLLLDKPSLGGTDLSGRVPPLRGVIIRRSYLLNLSSAVDTKTVGTGRRRSAGAAELKPTAPLHASPVEPPAGSSESTPQIPPQIAAETAQTLTPINVASLFEAARPKPIDVATLFAAQPRPQSIPLDVLFAATKTELPENKTEGNTESNAESKPEPTRTQSIPLDVLFAATKPEVSKTESKSIPLDVLFAATKSALPESKAESKAESKPEPTPSEKSTAALSESVLNLFQSVPRVASEPVAIPSPPAPSPLSSPLSLPLSAFLTPMDDPVEEEVAPNTTYRFGQASSSKNWWEKK